MNVLSIIWFTAAIAGGVAATVAVMMPRLRQRALTVAGVGFAIAGVLGIFSIGVLFIGLAVACFSRIENQPADPSLVPPPPPWPAAEVHGGTGMS